ncbi:hypothetical protein OLMES_2121 [Oleiphilus messinensis]|uniref:Nucleotidyltransferase family protein n=1 Tax=Oleiphilus messinensis TaxID=141451 RepID=A0A1Y0I9U1_9GAMM|nr:nucleotidyltransferase family protein [Oleiphilus messinensis]ARU56194.1 hypothetical protein OLMES_2121 [Oleiphilus messinensis]
MTTSLLIQILRNPAGVTELNGIAWSQLINESRTANLLGKLFWILKQNKLEKFIPQYALNHLESEFKQHQLQKNQSVWELSKVFNISQKIDVPILVLKGAAYFYSDQNAGEGRTLSDIDLLVEKKNLKAMEAALFANGWISKEVDDYDEKYYREWSHEIPPLIHYKSGTVIDLHHNIFPVLRHLNPPVEPLFEHALQTEKCGTLHPHDMIIHSATHLFWEGEFDNGLRDLVDIQQLLQSHVVDQENGWQELATRACALNLGQPLFYALRYCKAILYLPVPKACFKLLRQENKSAMRIPAGYGLLIMDWLFLHVLKPAHSHCASSGDALARQLLYWRGHLIKMPGKVLLPHLLKKTIKSLRKQEEKKLPDLN